MYEWAGSSASWTGRAAATRKNDETKGKRLYFFTNDEKQRHRDDEESRTRPLPLQLPPPPYSQSTPAEIVQDTLQ
jgi:hypothetical protein